VGQAASGHQGCLRAPRVLNERPSEDCTAEPMGADLSRSNDDATILLVERIFGSVSTSTDFIDALERSRALTSEKPPRLGQTL
jgi:hypothetical protein